MDLMVCTDIGQREKSETRRLKRKLSLSSCYVCEAEEAKYRCPSCLKFSCSLACVKQHKLDSGCCGVRDRTAFVALSQFSEVNLLNDYRLLEETARVADKPRRDSLLRSNSQYTFSVKLLKRNAQAAKVTLNILPKSFSRRKQNTSIYIKAEKKLYWHLKLHFPQSSAEYTERVQEDRVLEQIVNNYIHPTESDPAKRQRLKRYVLSFPDQLCVFMKSEQRQPGSLRYHKLDTKKSLRDNLMFKTVLEYPDLYVVLNGHYEEYLTHFPERKCVVQSSRSTVGDISHPAPSSSREHPQIPEDLKHREEKKNVTTESELEEGEIRSEEDDDDDDDSGVDGANDQSISVDKSLHSEDVDGDQVEDDSSVAPLSAQTPAVDTDCIHPSPDEEMEDDAQHCNSDQKVETSDTLPKDYVTSQIFGGVDHGDHDKGQDDDVE